MLSHAKIDVTPFKEKTGAAPTQKAVGNWTFATPHRRRWRWEGIAYKKACEQLRKKAATNGGAGVYTLLP